jgi:hypothetical protein
MVMMESARTSETSVDNYFRRQYNPEDKSERKLRFRHRKVFFVVNYFCAPFCKEKFCGVPSQDTVKFECYVIAYLRAENRISDLPDIEQSSNPNLTAFDITSTENVN